MTNALKQVWETGTGKCIIARKVHDQGGRCCKRFVKVDCGSIPSTWIENRIIARDALQAVEREHVVHVLEKCGWKTKGPGNEADRIGLKRSTLRSRLKKLGISRS